VSGRAVARAVDARWCLDWLDRLQELVRACGRFANAGQMDDVVDVVARARPFYARIAGGGD
jgi:hypothetical protein